MPETQQQYHPNMRRRKSALKSMKRKDTIGIILLGDERVGKTALINRWVHDKFSDEYKPTVEEFYEKTVISSNRRVKVAIVDIAGSGQFPTMDELYMVKSDCIVFVYEIGNEKSIKSMEHYFKKARSKISKTKHVRYHVIGTKFDTKVETSANFGGDDVRTGYFAELDEQPTQFVTSAKDGRGVDDAFENIVRDFMRIFTSVNSRHEKQFAKEIGEDIIEENQQNDRRCSCRIL